MAKVILICAGAVWGYSVIWNKLATVEHAIDRVTHESNLMGDMSARLQAVEKYTQQYKKDIEHLMSLQDAPITSDYQQFERIKYLEKELDILRVKMDRMGNGN